MLLFLFGAALALGGCAGTPGHESHGLHPFYESGVAGPEMSETVLRLGPTPLSFWRLTRAATNLDQTNYLWPLGYSRTEGRTSVHRFIPLFQDTRRIDKDGFIDHDFFGGLVPAFMFMWGRSEDEGSYFAVWPLGGKLKGYLGKDEIDFWLFPAYAKTRDAGFYSTHAAWPLVNWVWGEGNTGGRFWPFYGHYTRADSQNRPVFDRTHVAWPFFTAQRNNMNSAHPVRTRFFLPFYGSITSDNVEKHTVVDFLLLYFGRERLHKEGITRWHFPGPIWGYTHGPDLRQLDLIPFFGFRRTGPYYRHSVLWPLHRWEERDGDYAYMRRMWFLPLYWEVYAKDKPDGRETLRRNVFPLFSYDRESDGRTEWHVPDIRWFRAEAFTKLYAPWFWLVSRWTDPAAEKTATRALWGFYAADTDPSGHGWSLGNGLLERRRERGQAPRYRLFWLIAWGGGR